MYAGNSNAGLEITLQSVARVLHLRSVLIMASNPSRLRCNFHFEVGCAVPFQTEHKGESKVLVLSNLKSAKSSFSNLLVISASIITHYVDAVLKNLKKNRHTARTPFSNSITSQAGKAENVYSLEKSNLSEVVLH